MNLNPNLVQNHFTFNQNTGWDIQGLVVLPLPSIICLYPPNPTKQNGRIQIWFLWLLQQHSPLHCDVVPALRYGWQKFRNHGRQLSCMWSPLLYCEPYRCILPGSESSKDSRTEINRSKFVVWEELDNIGVFVFYITLSYNGRVAILTESLYWPSRYISRVVILAESLLDQSS